MSLSPVFESDGELAARRDEVTLDEVERILI